MREILFRAKRTDNGEWVEGFHVMYSTSIGYPYSYTDGEHHIFTVPHNISYLVDPETVCQYTGLTDKNDKKIWENDYISCKQYIGGNQIDYHVELGYVEMEHGAFGLHRIQGYYRPFKDWLEDYEYEVIGNIFDNPELLKENTNG